MDSIGDVRFDFEQNTADVFDSEIHGIPPSYQTTNRGISSSGEPGYKRRKGSLFRNAGISGDLHDSRAEVGLQGSLLESTLDEFRQKNSAGDAIVDETYGLRANSLARETASVVDFDRTSFLGPKVEEARRQGRQSKQVTLFSRATRKAVDERRRHIAAHRSRADAITALQQLLQQPPGDVHLSGIARKRRKDPSKKRFHDTGNDSTGLVDSMAWLGHTGI